MGRIATGAVLVLALGTLPASAAKVERVEVPGGSLRVEIPSTWARVPSAELEIRALFAAEATGGAAAEVYEAAFMPRGRSTSAGPPLLLVQAHQSGRLSWARFARLPPVDEVGALVAERLIGTGVPFGDRTSLRRLHFDRERYALEAASVVDDTPWGRLEVTSVLFLTSTGGIALHALSPADDERFGDLWRSISDSVEIDDDLRYHPRTADLWPWVLSWPLTWFLGAGLAAALTAWLVVRERRRRGAA